jgi:hypothetical protein
LETIGQDLRQMLRTPPHKPARGITNEYNAVRAWSVKRVASVVGEDPAVISKVWGYMKTLLAQRYQIELAANQKTP